MSSPTVRTSAGGSISSSGLPTRSRTQAKYRSFKFSILDQMPHARAEVIPAGIEREQRREPEQADADQTGDRQNQVTGLARDQEPDREQLQEGLPFREPRHRHADAQLGEIFAQARDQNLATENYDRGPQRPSTNGAVGGEHQQTGRDQELVGDRVEHAAETRLLAVRARDVAVEHVGEAGRDEDEQR